MPAASVLATAQESAGHIVGQDRVRADRVAARSGDDLLVSGYVEPPGA